MDKRSASCVSLRDNTEEDMSKLTAISIAISAIALGACAHPHNANNAARADYEATLSRIDRDYHAADARCDGYSGNAKDVCRAEAKAQRDKAEADAKAAYQGTAKSRYDQRIAAADADYKVARQRCDELAGDDKDVCIKDADAAYARAKADAKTAYYRY